MTEHTAGPSVPDVEGKPVEARVPEQAPRRPAGVIKTILGNDDADDDRPLPDLPPLPEDPRWRIEHLPFVLAVGFALVLCAASVGFFTGGPAAAAGMAAGALVVTIGVSLTTLTIAYADAVRPALVLPVGLAVYVIKYALFVFLLFAVFSSGWAGAIPMAWGLAGTAVVLTGVQVWWLSRLATRRLP